jgi:hypothetical protein
MMKRIASFVLAFLLLFCTVAHADYSSTLDSIYSSYRSGNTRADNVYQQIANGSYRAFEAAYVIAQILDTTGAYSSTLDSIYSSYRSGNTRADNVYQQIANGSYRTFEALYVVAQIYDR